MMTNQLLCRCKIDVKHYRPTKKLMKTKVTEEKIVLIAEGEKGVGAIQAEVPEVNN